MNRHERRAQAATQSFPDGYIKEVERLDVIVRAAIEQGYAPRFRMAPKGIMVAAGLDQLGHALALNDAAHAIIVLALEGTSIQKGPTVTMLEVVLQQNKVEVERVGLSELGIGPTGGMS